MESIGICITVVHGQNKYSLALDDNPDQTVAYVRDKIEQLTGVPSTSQKLIHKGKSLQPPELLLSDFGVKNGSTVMVLGKKFDPESEAVYQEITKLGSAADNAEVLLGDIGSEIEGIEQGFLAPELVVQSLGKLEKRLKKTSELCLKTLETLDAMSLKDESKQVRSARKALVERLQALLDRGDLMLEKVNMLLTR
jgi:hypothetical protein